MRTRGKVNKITRAQFKTLYAKTTSKQKNKLVNYKWVHDGKLTIVKFGSIKEYHRGLMLIKKLKRGDIRNLEFQKKIKVIQDVPGEIDVVYILDAFYYQVEPVWMKTIKRAKPVLVSKTYVMEDTKSEFTRKNPEYVIKRKLSKLHYPDFFFHEFI